MPELFLSLRPPYSSAPSLRPGRLRRGDVVLEVPSLHECPAADSAHRQLAPGNDPVEAGDRDTELLGRLREAEKTLFGRHHALCYHEVVKTINCYLFILQ